MNEEILNVSGLKVKIGKKTILDGIEVRFSRGECVLIAFVWAFTKFDARPVSVFNKRYLARLAGIFLLGTAAALLYAYQTTDIGDTTYYEARDHEVLMKPLVKLGLGEPVRPGAWMIPTDWA
jgi:hypothetical protein